MTDYPLVSCLMPTMNRRAFIPRALAMFEAQDYPNRELIVLEDGDEDSSELCYASADRFRAFGITHGFPRVRYFRFGGTLGAKLNQGARAAFGEILIRWDDDDWNAPNRISTQVAHMKLTGKPVVGMSSLIYYTEREQFGYEYTGDAWYASGSSHCYTREYALSHPMPDISLGEDNAFAAEAKLLDAISNISGLTCLVACDHTANTSPRMFGPDLNFIRETADNFRKVPLAEFAETIGPHGSH
jgi:glycosyltransferase involved in cell wall biosynthesis